MSLIDPIRKSSIPLWAFCLKGEGEDQERSRLRAAQSCTSLGRCVRPDYCLSTTVYPNRLGRALPLTQARLLRCGGSRLLLAINLRRLAFHDGDTRIGSAEVDADDLAHGYIPRGALWRY
jgi:hypothetical protein